jgi:DNA-binding transcriptional regulator of glucitol operon
MAPNSTMKSTAVVGVTVVILLLDLLGVTYATSHGLNVGAKSLAGLTLPLQWLPVIGIALVSLVTWSEIFTRIFPRRAAPMPDPLVRLRLMRVIVIALAAFVCFLFIPYLLGSNWFWAKLSHLSRSISQLREFGNWLLGTEAQVTSLDAIWQYATLQTIATAAMILAAWVFTRPPRRPKFR